MIAYFQQFGMVWEASGTLLWKKSHTQQRTVAINNEKDFCDKKCKRATCKRNND